MIRRVFVCKGYFDTTSLERIFDLRERRAHCEHRPAFAAAGFHQFAAAARHAREIALAVDARRAQRREFPVAVPCVGLRIYAEAL